MCVNQSIILSLSEYSDIKYHGNIISQNALNEVSISLLLAYAIEFCGKYMIHGRLYRKFAKEQISLKGSTYLGEGISGFQLCAWDSYILLEL